jgi:large subunit ribosomal protein L1
MQGEKLTRFVDNFNRMAAINYKFDHGQERTILAFCKGQEEIDAARSAGATLAGGSELVKQIQSGDLHLPEFEHVIASTNVLPEILPIRGLLKKRFPNVKNGTLGNNIDEMVTRAMIGINYSATKDLYQKNFGTISSQFGTLDMPVEHLQDNLKNLLIDIDKMRPKREGKFITRVLIKSPPSQEELKIDPYQFVAESRSDFKKSKDLVEEEEEVEEGEDVEKK